MATPPAVDSFIGGCLCGALRYRANGHPIDAGYCHCRLCQRSSGAPVLAWATFAKEQFSYVRGKPAIYRSSSQSQREFCATCGTQLAFRRQFAATTVDLTLASLDDPAAIRPDYHIWSDCRISWLHIEDDLPRYVDAGPDEG